MDMATKEQLTNSLYLHNNIAHFDYFYMNGNNDSLVQINSAQVKISGFLNGISEKINQTLQFLKSLQLIYMESKFNIPKSLSDSLESINKYYYEKIKEKQTKYVDLEEYIRKKRWVRSFTRNYEKQILDFVNVKTPNQLAKDAFLETLKNSKILKSEGVRDFATSFISWIDSMENPFQIEFDVIFTTEEKVEIKKKIRSQGNIALDTFLHNEFLKNFSNNFSGEKIINYIIDNMNENLGIPNEIEIGQASIITDYSIFEKRIEEIFSSHLKTHGVAKTKKAIKSPSITPINMRQVFSEITHNSQIKSKGNRVDLEEILNNMSISNNLIFYPIINYMQLNDQSNLTAFNAGNLSELIQSLHQIITMMTIYRMSSDFVPKMAAAVSINASNIQSTKSSISNMNIDNTEKEAILMTLDWQIINDLIIPSIAVFEQLQLWILEAKNRINAINFSTMAIKMTPYSEQEMMDLHYDKKQAISSPVPPNIADWRYPGGILDVGSTYGNVLAGSMDVHTNMYYLVQQIESMLSSFIS